MVNASSVIAKTNNFSVISLYISLLDLDMSYKIKATIIVMALVVMGGSICSTSMSTAASAQSNYTIKVAKTTEGDFTVTNGTSYVGSSFETTYSMRGTTTDFIKARDALTSSILDDFGKSPTIGYIKMNSTDTQTNTNATGLANPFASKERINEKVKSVLSYALDKIEHPVGITPNVGDSRELRCVFGSVLNDFWCDIPTFMVK
jgi:hypothetical protein